MTPKLPLHSTAFNADSYANAAFRRRLYVLFFPFGPPLPYPCVGGNPVWGKPSQLGGNWALQGATAQPDATKNRNVFFFSSLFDQQGFYSILPAHKVQRPFSDPCRVSLDE